MLTNQQIEIVKSTVPVLQLHGETITKAFYRNLFEENPGLKDIFNMANQANGDQQRSLAASVVAYAANIDQLQNLGPAVSLIAHKHCSLDVLPEHYPIVGRNLMRAICEVLGDAVTPEVTDAWGAAYNQLADILIGIEGKMYSENVARGWAGFKPFTVSQKRKESETITSFELTPEDGKPLPVHQPGQFLSIQVKGVGENTEIRQYTISSRTNGRTYRISVKREPSGVVSNYLHDIVEEGDSLSIHMPHGDFVLREDEFGPVALISGGVGITPVLAMLERLVEVRTERPVVFAHAAIDGSVHAFRDYVRELVADHPNIEVCFIYAEPSSDDAPGVHYDLAGLVSKSILGNLVPPNADCYCCGPKGFMRVVDTALDELGVPASHRRQEVFGPTLELAQPTSTT